MSIDLKREIGMLDATMIVISGVIGGGIFFTPAVVAQALPASSWIFAVWLIGALIAFAGALTFAELGARFPEAGGHYVYIRNAFGGLPAFLYGWMLLLIIATGALASLALAFAHYVATFVALSDLTQRLLGAGTIVALSVINILGVKPGTRTTTALTAVKVLALGTLIVVGLLVPHHAAPAAPVFAPSSPLAAFSIALVPVLFSYGGWQQLNQVAGEVREAQRTVPIALAIGVSIIALIYLGANAVYLRALGPAGMANSSAIAQGTAVSLFGDTAARVVTILIGISILAFSNVVVMATPRVLYALAQDRVFLRGLGTLHPRYHTPAYAIALQCGWAVVLVMVGSIGVLVNGVVFADWIFFGLGAASLFVLRRRAAGDVAYRTPGYPIVPAFFVLAAIVAVASAVGAYPKESLIGVAMLAVGSMLYAVRR